MVHGANNCEWLMRNRKENCGKRCVGTYCRRHNHQLTKGIKMSAPCRSCGVGVLCDYCLCFSCGGSVLQMFCGPITMEVNRNLHQPLQPQRAVLYDSFHISQNNFQDWLRFWRMNVLEKNSRSCKRVRFSPHVTVYQISYKRVRF